MTLRLSNILVLLCLAPLFSCVSPLPQRTPAADLPEDDLPLTIPVIAIGDTQEHEARQDSPCTITMARGTRR